MAKGINLSLYGIRKCDFQVSFVLLKVASRLLIASTFVSLANTRLRYLEIARSKFLTLIGLSK